MFSSIRVPIGFAASAVTLAAAIAAHPILASAEGFEMGPGMRGAGVLTPGSAKKHDPEAARRQREFFVLLAGRLGISVQQLSAAVQDSLVDQVEKGVAEGKYSRVEGDRMIQQIHPDLGIGLHPQGLRAAAQVLGLQPRQLRDELQRGRSLAEVAADKGVSRDDLKQRLRDTQKAASKTAVARGDVSADRAAEVAQRLEQKLDSIIDRKSGEALSAATAPAPAGAAKQIKSKP